MKTKFEKYVEHCLKMRDKFGDADLHCNIVIMNKPLNPIKKVIFNDPATIVYWIDETKTVVKAGEGTIFDPEKGLAMAISKKFFGNQGNYYNAFRKYLENADACDITSNYKKLINDLDHAETDLYNCRLYLDKIFELDPSMYDRMMEEYSGMPGYVSSKSTIGE